jgi:hypothetical protein
MHDGDETIIVGFCSDECAHKAVSRPDCPNGRTGCFGPLDLSLGLAWELHPNGDILLQRAVIPPSDCVAESDGFQARKVKSKCRRRK